MTKENQMVVAVARAIYEGRNGAGAKAFASQPLTHRQPYLTDARAAMVAMRGYSEAMSQAGGYVPKMQYGDPMPVGQSIAERCYLAMIEAALQAPEPK